MKLGINMLLWTGSVGEEHASVLEQLAGLGYDGVEIPVMGGTPESYRALGRRLDDLGLQRTSSTALPGEHADPISPDPGVRRAGVDFLKHCIDCVAELGSGLLCGPTYQALGRFTGEGPTDQEQAWALEAHREAADHAAPAGITIAVEPLNRFECYFLNTMAAAEAHSVLVDRPNFGVLYDTFHANIEEKDPVQALEGHVGAVRHVHLSENDRGTPGQGHVPFKAVLETLRHHRYDGWLVIEAFGRTVPELAAATRIWRDCFNSPEDLAAQALPAIRQLM